VNRVSSIAITAWHTRQASRALRDGGVIAYPTETVYGLGCDPLNLYAVKELLALKHRPMEKGLILIAAELHQLLPYINISDSALLEKLETPRTHPTTWVVPARPDTPTWLTGAHNSIAVRLTTHPLAAALCIEFGGAIVSTSANPARRPPALSAFAVRRYFGDRLDYLLHTSKHANTRPSEIRELISDKVIRQI
jgi:L-threonylcarbamoyladenylate synthase